VSLETHNRRTLGAAALVACMLAVPSAARAQSPGTDIPSDTAPPFWEFIGGYEGDTHNAGYGFLGPQYNHPLSDDLAVTARIFATHLHYKFTNNLGGETTVHSPGISPAIGLRFGHHTTFKVSVGYAGKNEHREITDRAGRIVSDETKWKSGLNLGGELYWNLDKRDNIHALANFSTVDDYVWARAGYKRQVSNYDWKGGTTLYLGFEGITQGNKDIRSNSVGALAEILFVPAHFSVMVRGGYKHSTFKVGDSQNGPYYGVGIYKRF
jgi:cellulose biosynthesis protein BcsS